MSLRLILARVSGVVFVASLIVFLFGAMFVCANFGAGLDPSVTYPVASATLAILFASFAGSVTGPLDS